MKKTTYYGRYPTAAAKVFKHADVIHCQIDGDGIIWATEGHCALQLSNSEYDKIVRPAVMRDPGNWALRNGEITEGANIDARKYFFDSLQKADAAALDRSTLQHRSGSKTIDLFRNPGTGAIIHIDSIFSECIPECCTVYGSSPVGVIFAGTDPQDLFMMFCPIRGNDAITRAASAYFSAIDGQKDPADDLRREISRLESENEKLRRHSEAAQDPGQLQQIEALQAMNADMLQQIDVLQAFAGSAAAAAEEKQQRIDSLQARIISALQQVDAMRAQVDALQAAAAPAASPATESSGNHSVSVDAAADRFRAIPGAVVTVKGAQTAAPVIWISGQAADAIRAAGARWSDKKQAFYFKCA